MSLAKLRAKKAQKIKEMRAIVDGAKEDGRAELNAEENELYDAYKKDVASIEATMDRTTELESFEAELEEVVPAASRGRVIPGGPDPKKEWAEGEAGFGEFMHAVRFKQNDPRLEFNANVGAAVDHRTDDAQHGGFMVPKQYIDKMLRVPVSETIVRGRAQVIEAGNPPDAAVGIPALVQDSTANLYGGVTVSWIAEGDEKPKTDASFQDIELKPKEVAGHVVVTDKLLRNWRAAGPFLANLLRGAIKESEDQAFLTGGGTNRPLGALNANNGARVLVSRTTAGTIKYLDVVAMYAKARHGGDLLWLVNQTALPKLMTMEDTEGHLIWQPSAREGEPATLLGIPVKITPRVPTVGNTADLSLIDFGYYIIKDGSGIFVQASEHVYFTSNKTVIKAFWNVDGQPWLRAPIREVDGQDYSPFVCLGPAA